MAYVKGEPFKFQKVDNSGDTAVSYTVEFYIWDTSTPQAYYTDSIGTSGGTSLTLAADGEPSTDIFYDDSVVYKMVVKDAGGSTLDPIGPYYPPRAAYDSHTETEVLAFVKALDPSQWPTVSNGTDASHDIDFAAGSILDSTGATALVGTAMTKQIDATWAAGDAAGGLFTGTVAADTTYHLFIIENDSDSTIDYGFDTSVTAANIPSGYIKYRRIASLITDSSSNIVGFTQIGRHFIFDVNRSAYSAADPGTSAVLVDTTIPQGVKLKWLGHIKLIDATASASTNCLFTSPDQTDGVPSSTNSTLRTLQDAVTSVCYAEYFTDTSAQIRFRLGASDPDISVKVSSVGWIDYLDS